MTHGTSSNVTRSRVHVRRWDEEAIRAGLTEFLDGWDRWPTCREFAEGGAKGLREVIIRVHGAEWWAAEMGLPGGDRPPGGVRRWTDDAIRASLHELIGDSGRWPTSREFDDSGLHRLREALRHYGGPERWSREMHVSWTPSPRPGRRREPPATRGSPASGRSWPKWTEESIGSELERFLAGRSDWPRHREFVAAGRQGLYHAVLKHGGTHVWAARMGVRFRVRPGGREPWSEERVRAELAVFLRERDHWPSGAEFGAAGRDALLRAARRFGGSRRWQREFGLRPRRS